MYGLTRENPALYRQLTEDVFIATEMYHRRVQNEIVAIRNKTRQKVLNYNQVENFCQTDLVGVHLSMKLNKQDALTHEYRLNMPT
jgi:predicted transcriptional regulator